MISAGSVVEVVHGNKARNVVKRSRWVCLSTESLGSAHSHQVRVRLGAGDRTIAWYARHQNRLSDAIVSLNDGNPFHKIRVREVEAPAFALRG